MHPKTLITPRYWLAKLNRGVFERRFPDSPWLSESAVYMLDSWLRPTDRGIEWGAGRSTVWFASRVEHLTSIESDQQWYAQTTRLLKEKNVTEKVDLRSIPVDDVSEGDSPVAHPYGDVVEEFTDDSLDFALVDGIKLRLLCVEKVISKIKPGGLLILDNAEYFLPDTIMGQHTVVLEPRDSVISERWEEVLGCLSKWRAIYTTNGVTNTLMWIRPLL